MEKHFLPCHKTRGSFYFFPCFVKWIKSMKQIYDKREKGQMISCPGVGWYLLGSDLPKTSFNLRMLQLFPG